MEIETNQEFLRRPCREVYEADNPDVVIAKLFDALKENDHFLGIAANQIREPLRIFVIVMRPGKPICLINPKIVKEKGKEKKPEACLSLPGVIWKVTRPREIKIEGYNQYMKFVRYHLKGIDARTACHEVDHLNGILIIDHDIPPEAEGLKRSTLDILKTGLEPTPG